MPKQNPKPLNLAKELSAKPFVSEYVPQGRKIKIKGGNYIVKLVKERWYHKVFRLNKAKCRQIGVVTLNMSVFIDNRGNFKSESKSIPLQKGEVEL